MEKDPAQHPIDSNDEERYAPPAVVEKGRIEAKLFSDEPDPWGP